MAQTTEWINQSITWQMFVETAWKWKKLDQNHGHASLFVLLKQQMIFLVDAISGIDTPGESLNEEDHVLSTTNINRKLYKQECIPVGCIPSTAVAVSPGEGRAASVKSRHPPLEQTPPQNRHPLEQTPPPAADTPWEQTPPEQTPDEQTLPTEQTHSRRSRHPPWSRHPPLSTDRCL